MAEPLRATFFALRRRERSGVLVRATCIYLFCSFVVVSVGFIGIAWALGREPFEWLQTMVQGQAAEQQPAPTLRSLWLFPLFLFLAFIYCALTAAYEAACLRWMIRGETKEWFDDDTWRVYGVYWAWFGFAIVWGLAFWIVTALLALLGAGPIASGIALTLLGLCAALAAVAFAPAAATSIATGRFAFFDAVDVSDNHFLSLIGSFALLLGGQWILSNAITVGWWTWALGPDWADHFRDVQDYFGLARAQNAVTVAALSVSGGTFWAISAVSAVMSIIVNVLVYGVNARAASLAMEEGTIKSA